MAYQFTEKTRHEQGFSQLWDRYMAPHMDAYAKDYRRYTLLAIITITPSLAVFFGGAYYMIEVVDAKQDFRFNLIFLAMLAVTSGICYLGYRPLGRLKNASGAQLFAALSEHFKSQFVPYEDKDELDDVAGFLQDERLTSPGSIDIGASFICAHPDKHYRFFNVTYTSGSDKNRTIVHYLVIHLKLHITVPDKIRILPDRGVANGVVRFFTRRKNVRLSNKAFEKQFEVYSHNEALTTALLTEPLQQSFVDMKTYFSNGRRWWQGRCKVTAMLEKDEMVICLEGLNDIAGHRLAGSSPSKVVNAAHIAIQRLSQIPFVVAKMREVMPEIKGQSD